MRGERIRLERNRFYNGTRVRHVDRFVAELGADQGSLVDDIASGRYDWGGVNASSGAARAAELARRYGINKGQYWAIDRALPATLSRRSRAARAILSAEPMPVPDVQELRGSARPRTTARDRRRQDGPRRRARSDRARGRGGRPVSADTAFAEVPRLRFLELGSPALRELIAEA